MRKQANFKLPEELLAALQDRAAQERTSATDLVIQALKSFLGEPTEEDLRIGSSIYDIADCVEQLKDRVDKLEATKNFYFMYNSPSCEANDVDIRIDSDSLIPNSSEENILLLNRVEELEKQNENLRERLATLEALVQEYNYQALSRSTTREFQ
ncbi:hypothetical protein [Nostoc sp. FACHB-190]|uniref:hypothetical protein n=1 Tax=Nostoc sp. FACHB-190 TaxID=2692838 RepID=UPI001685BB36|nr:hypothetical protein [Nostoc sp. FACHB-190]MBD2303216.1 hypothetical protein [Nostoc sp. FACHB-190]